MFQCDIHPYKMCTFYDTDSQSLQCAQCVLPPKILDQNEGLIDIEKMTYIANNLIESYPQSQSLFDLQGLWSKVENALYESQEKAQHILEHTYDQLKSQLLQYFELFKKENDQLRQEFLKNSQACKQVKSLLLNIHKQVAQPQYIESIRELNDSIESLHKYDSQQPIQRLNILQSRFMNQVDQQLADFNDYFSKTFQSRTLEFEEFAKNPDLDKSQTYSRSNTITSVVKRRKNESVNQVVNKQMRCNLPTQYQLTSVICCVTLVIVGTLEGSLLLYDNESWEEVQHLKSHEGQIKVLCKQKGEQTYVASGSLDKTIKIFKREFNEDTAQFFLSEQFHLNGHHGAILDLLMVDQLKHKQFKNINILVSSSADNTVRIWNYMTGEAMMNYSGHSMDVHALAFSPQLNQICSGSNDKTIRVWDAICYEACRPLQKLTGHTDSVLGLVVLEEKPSILLSCGSDKSIKMWDLRKVILIRSFNVGRFMSRIVQYQNGLVAVIGLDQNIDIWDYNITIQVHQLKGTGKIQSIYVDEGNVYSVENKNINLYY